MSTRDAKRDLEVEVKLKVSSPAALRRRLLALGWTEKVPRSLEQNWTWDFPDQRLRRKGQLLRLRQFGGECSLTFKGMPIGSRLFKVRKELETRVGDIGVLARILELLGLQIVFRYEKFRTAYFFKLSGGRGWVYVTVDETPIGNYLEIEGSQRSISYLAKQLGYGPQDFIKESYGTLFQRSQLGRQQSDMVFQKRLKRIELSGIRG